MDKNGNVVDNFGVFLDSFGNVLDNFGTISAQFGNAKSTKSRIISP